MWYLGPGPVSCMAIPWFWQSFYKAQRVQETLHYYSSIMLNSFASLLRSKLCRHNVDNPNDGLKIILHVGGFLSGGYPSYMYCRFLIWINLAFVSHRLFKRKVSQSRSSVKISDQVDRNSPKLIEAVFWSSLLDNVFKENLKNDPELRYVCALYLTPSPLRIVVGDYS